MHLCFLRQCWTNSMTTYMQISIRRGTMTGGNLISCTNALLSIVTTISNHGTVAGRPKANGYCIYINPPSCLHAQRACLIQCQISNLLKKKGVEDSFLLKGKQVLGGFIHFHARSLFRLLVRLFFPPPFPCAFAPKHSPNGCPKNVNNLKNQ